MNINIKKEIKMEKNKNIEQQILDTVRMIGEGLYLQNNYHLRRMATRYNRTGLTTYMPSRTVQGQDYSIKDLLIKHANGVMPAVQMNGQYDETADFDNLTLSDIVHMDKEEIESMLISNGQKINELTKLLTQERKQEVEKTSEKQTE